MSHHEKKLNCPPKNQDKSKDILQEKEQGIYWDTVG